MLWGGDRRVLPYGNLAKTLVANGYDFDIVNDDLLQHRAQFGDGGGAINGYKYRVLVLPRATVVPIESMSAIKTLSVQQIIAGENGKWIFDLGQNIAGWARIHVKAPAGTQLTMKFGETLLPDGKKIDFGTTGKFATGVEQTQIYVCKGGGVETWSPRFTYHGFRYIEVAGLSKPPDKHFLEGVLVHTDVTPQGSFTCSDELLNRIYRISMWTIEDNMHSVMEDCPHREKCGWLGDAHATGETTMFNYDMA